MSDTSQNEKKARTEGNHMKDQGRFFLNSEIAKRFMSPWTLYIPFAGFYSSWSLYVLLRYGPLMPIAPFCVPVAMMTTWWCYEGLPLSMLALSTSMLAFVPRWGWYSGCIAAIGGIGYDMTGGGLNLTGNFSLFFVQLIALVGVFIVLRTKKFQVKPSWVLIAYLAANLSALTQPVILALGSYWEPVAIFWFCIAVYRSVIPNVEEPPDSG